MYTYFVYIYIQVVGGLRGGFVHPFSPHHITIHHIHFSPSFFTHHITKKNHIHQPISCIHLIIHHITIHHIHFSPSFIFTHHITKKNHIHQPISCTHLIIIFHLHFSSHSYHQKNSSSFIFHYHLIHHLNTPRRPLIENRLVKNIDTLIS